MLGILFNKIPCISITQSFSLIFSPGNTYKYLLRLIKLSAQPLTFKPRGLLIPWRIVRFFLDSALTGKIMYPNVNNRCQVSCVALTISAYNMPNWHTTYPRTSVKSYLIFAPFPSIPDASRVMLKLGINNKNSPGSPLSNKTILNS